MTKLKSSAELGVNSIITALVARTQLGQVLERAAGNSERFLVARRGEATAVILGVEDYMKNVVRKPKLMGRLAQQAALSGTGRLSLEQIQDRIRQVSQDSGEEEK